MTNYVPLPPLGSHPSDDPFCSTKAISVASSRGRDAGLDKAQQQDLKAVQLQGKIKLQSYSGDIKNCRILKAL